MADASGLFGRTIAPLKRAIFGHDIEANGGDLSASGVERLREQIDECLQYKGGEVSARGRAVELGKTYLELSTEGRAKFLNLLVTDYGVDKASLDTALTTLNDADDPLARHDAERRLKAALEPRRVALLRQFNAVPEGVKFLVDMRAELLPMQRENPALRALNDDLRDLLVSWFDIGFLDLKQITWDAPASLLEKLIAYEAVHEIRSWDDLKNRLDSDRRCFAFFHPRMPDEPLIFVEVALVHGMADNVQELLDEAAPEQDPDKVDTAIFYSISNAQSGLAGVSFGNFLIKRVVDELCRDLPNLKTFATLSPVPGFRRWLDKALTAREPVLWNDATAAKLAELGEAEDAFEGERNLLNRDDWWQEPKLAELLRPVLTRQCTHYLFQEKRGQSTLDRVEHFHLTNGARLERLNWLADTSPNGLRQSAGMMVNYLYKLREIERNHEAYSVAGRVTASPTVKRVLG